MSVPPITLAPLPPSPTSPWDLELVLQRISGGKIISDEAGVQVVDIGDNTVVKYGDRVRSTEGMATQLVAQWTSIPVAEIYAILNDGITYIVQRKLKGEKLIDLLPSLPDESRVVLESELAAIYRQLSFLNGRGPMGIAGHPGHFEGGLFARFSDYGLYTADNTEEFVKWLLTQIDEYSPQPLDASLQAFDFGRNPVFSHGDFVPENILVHEGHISGIIDWELAGWYPYFWDDYIARFRLRSPAFKDGKWNQMLPAIIPSFPTAVQYWDKLYSFADLYL